MPIDHLLTGGQFSCLFCSITSGGWRAKLTTLEDLGLGFFLQEIDIRQHFLLCQRIGDLFALSLAKLNVRCCRLCYLADTEHAVTLAWQVNTDKCWQFGRIGLHDSQESCLIPTLGFHPRCHFGFTETGRIVLDLEFSTH